MKKILVAFILIPFNVIAQHLIPESYIFYDKTDTGWTMVAKRNFIYDSKSKLTGTEDSKIKNGEWKVGRKTEIQYSGDTLRTEVQYEFNGASWSRYRDQYTLDVSGTEIGFTSESFDTLNKTWNPMVKGQYLKNKDGKVIEKKYQRLKDGSWQNEDMSVMTYNSKGLLAEELWKNWENGMWLDIVKTKYDYGIDTLLKSSEIYSRSESSSVPGTLQSIPGRRNIYEYDWQGNLQTFIVQGFNNGRWEDKSKRQSIYPEDKHVHFYNPRWSPDGKSIAFESAVGGKSDIYIISSDGSNLKKITDTTDDYGQPAWSADGRQLVYYGSQHPMQLFIRSVAGGAQIKLATPGIDAYEPSWSANNKIVFDSRPIGQTPNDLSVIDADGSQYRKITDGNYDYSSAQWSPDGKKILFERSVAVKKKWKDITPDERIQMRDSLEVMVMNADGTGIRNLTNNSIQDNSAGWSSDGSDVFFISVTESGRILFRLKLNSTKPELVFKLPVTVSGVCISPDQKYLMYKDSRDNRNGIYIWDLENKSERELTGN